MWARIKNIVLGNKAQQHVAVPEKYFAPATGQETEQFFPVDAPEHRVKPKSFRAVPLYKPHLSIRIAAAATNMASTNIDAVRHYGLGSELTSEFIPQTGFLRLGYAGGISAVYPAQVLGSLDITERHFLWAWANPAFHADITALVRRIQAQGEETGEALLVEERQNLHFDEVISLVTFAAQDGGMPLVYRCIMKGSAAVFLALGEPRFMSANGQLINSPFSTSAPTPEERDFVEAQDAVLAHDHERLFAASGEPAVYDATTDIAEFMATHVAGGVLHVRIPDDGPAFARRITHVAGQGQCVETIAGWGSSLIWPKV